MEFDSFGSHQITIGKWETWEKEGKFEGLKIPDSFTSSMVAAIEAMDTNNIELLKTAINFASKFNSQNESGKNRLQFLTSYAKKIKFPISLFL